MAIPSCLTRSLLLRFGRFVSPLRPKNGGCVPVVLAVPVDSGLLFQLFRPRRPCCSGSPAAQWLLAWFPVPADFSPGEEEGPVHKLSPGRHGQRPALLQRTATCLFSTPHLNIRTTSSRRPASRWIRRAAPSAVAGLKPCSMALRGRPCKSSQARCFKDFLVLKEVRKAR